MSDPVPAISESEATGLIAQIYADIRSVNRVSAVNLIWRHLATIPGALPWVWTTISCPLDDNRLALSYRGRVQNLLAEVLK